VVSCLGCFGWLGGGKQVCEMKRADATFILEFFRRTEESERYVL
jgi:hypothetical protein